MKKVQEYDLVRHLFYRDHLSRRDISRRTGYHRRTINRMLQYSSPPGYCLKNPRPKTKLEPFLPIIDQILEDDRKAPKKQSHTAKRIFDRLCVEHGFDGSYTIVKDYIRDKKISLREVFFPLKQEPGTAQVDFGKVKVIIGGLLQDAQVFCMGLPYSDAMLVQAYPTEGFEAVAAGHNAAYAFFEGVPPQSLYDNMSTAVKSVGKGHERELTDDFLKLRSHYLFESRFCNVGRPNEKGVVEGLIGYTRRNLFVPTLSFPSHKAMNDYLLEQCYKRLLQKASGKEKTIGELLAEERAYFLPLPTQEFEACRTPQARRVNSLSLVKFKNNNYSVPVEYAYRDVLIKVFVFFLQICYKEVVIATHRRSHLRDDFVFDPLHYLPLLKKKPGALEGAMPFCNWELPKSFETLQRYLAARNGNDGKREYIKVLQLLRQFPAREISRAIEAAFAYGCVTFEAIRLLARSGQEPAVAMLRLSEERLSGFPRVQVALTDITCYCTLLPGIKS
jgi:transposase